LSDRILTTAPQPAPVDDSQLADDAASTIPYAGPSAPPPAPRLSRAEREAHPLFTDGTEILGGEPLRGHATLTGLGSPPAPPGPPAPPTPPAFLARRAADTETHPYTEAAIITQARGGRGGGGRGGRKAKSGRGGGHGSDTEIDDAPSPVEETAVAPKARGGTRKK
ncbi:hypothetical protein V5O48_019354, partial [Marasmius crinis-equi]